MEEQTNLNTEFTTEFTEDIPSSNPRNFDGLQVRIDGSQLLDAGSTSGGDPLSLAMLDELIDAVDIPTHLIMDEMASRNLRSKLARQTRSRY